MTDTAPIVIIGTGLSGYSLVREMRKLDKETPILMITADDGRSYSKPMLSTGFTRKKTPDELAQADPGAMAEQFNIEVRTFTTVTRLDPDNHQVWVGDEAIAYRKLVLAWGADVIRLPLEGDGLGRVYSINDLMDYQAFRDALGDGRRVAIMGAGLIGCEFANDLRNGGYEADVIAPCETTLPGLLPEEAGQAIEAGLREMGVNFHLQNRVERVDQAGEGVRLTLADGETLEADLVLSAVGLRPRVELAREAGLEVNRGIVVNRALETSAPDVYALGDCAEVDGYVLLYVLPLMACARALAKTLAGERTPVAYGAMPVVIKTPCCPTAVCPPPRDAQGEWQIEAEGKDVRGIFRDGSGASLGFVVTGRHAQEKQALAREMPPLHD